MRRSIAKTFAVLCTCALAAPAVSVADPGGPGPTDTSDVSSAGDVTLSAERGALVRRLHAFAGSAPAGRTVLVQRRSGEEWTTVAEALADADGTWTAGYPPQRPGRYRYRAALAAAEGEARVAAAGAEDFPEVAVTVFRATRATWYGPGLYGNGLACGGRLTERTLGVAHRTLPCGTRVALLYRGRSLTVKVVDRGPFGAGADFDLTSATAKRLGMTGTSRLGALVLGS
jgi:peptidoglycan lytic transglycosylase